MWAAVTFSRACRSRFWSRGILTQYAVMSNWLHCGPWHWSFTSFQIMPSLILSGSRLFLVFGSSFRSWKNLYLHVNLQLSSLDADWLPWSFLLFWVSVRPVSAVAFNAAKRNYQLQSFLITSENLTGLYLSLHIHFWSRSVSTYMSKINSNSCTQILFLKSLRMHAVESLQPGKKTFQRHH